jgi:hypothetical protein
LKKEKKETGTSHLLFNVTEMNELQVRVLNEGDAIGYNNNSYYFSYKRGKKKKKMLHLK